MKLAKYAYLTTLLILTLAIAAVAQGNHTKSVDDPRNTTSTVGTGGPQGGPTGLFTVYDGQTLRKGEYTFSFAYSNYDRDPGNVDITDMPGSFQVGITDNLEFFYSIEAWRNIKVNNPRNLSSFYLPNSGLTIGGVRKLGPAIVLAPQGATTTALTGMAVFRPTGMPFNSFPYTGGDAGTYGFTGVGTNCSAVAFGFAANCAVPNATLGPPRLASGNGADLFPGVGSVYGSILPGIVLSTELVACAAVGAAPTTCESPQSFSTKPTYLPDAPYVNRLYSNSSINKMTAGIKWRFNDVMKPWGVGLVAFYRYNRDRADNVAGFNQLQRGAGAGDNKGDVGVGLFWDGRLTKHINLSANATYLYTTKSKGKFNGATFTMLDTPDELQTSIGIDFPINKYFQPIIEVRDLHYVGGRTPNALENNPMEAIAGFRWFPARWWGIGAAYRIHLNQQDSASFDGDSTIVAVTNRCGNSTNCSSTTVTRTFTGVPPGFVPSQNPHGAILQAWIGRRDPRQGPIENKPPSVDSVDISDTTITLPCPQGQVSRSGAACNDNRTVNVSAHASDPENDVLTYNYTTSGGRIVGTGANVQWDLSGVGPGTYTITTGVDDGCGVCGKTDTRTVRVENCPDCYTPVTCSCPTLSVSGPSGITNPGDSMTFTANAAGGTGNYTYNWSVSSGTITSGQGTPSITVATTRDMGGQSVTATVDLGGTQPNCGCPTNASETAGIAARPTPQLVDEFGPQKDDEVKARVDNFYIQLNNNPTAQGYVIIYGNAAEIKKRRAQIMKAINFRKYDANRITFVESTNGGGVNTKFYLVPAGADNPNP